MKTGYKKLDELININKPKLVLLGSRPSMGKTTLALNIATNIALRENMPVAIFNLELSKEQMINRILCSEAMVDCNKVSAGNLEDTDWEKISKTTRLLLETRIYIDDTPGISVMEIKEKCRKLKSEKNIGLIIIDYLQLIQYDKTKLLSRDNEIKNIMQELKEISQELKITILVTSQLSRKPEYRNEHRPILTDLRTNIVEIADAIIFLYRDEYYNDNTDLKNIAELNVLKNNNDKTGIIYLLYMNKYLKFVDLNEKEWR
jgi:replicative DNA helicase